MTAKKLAKDIETESKYKEETAKTCALSYLTDGKKPETESASLAYYNHAKILDTVLGKLRGVETSEYRMAHMLILLLRQNDNKLPRYEHSEYVKADLKAIFGVTDLEDINL